MSGETLIRIVNDVLLEDGCSNTWQFVSCESSDGASVPFYFCAKHEARVPLDGPCPLSEFWARKGETVSVPSKVARRLVESELAEYPTHATEPDQGVQETLGRVNDLLEAEGLPLTDAEALGVWKIEGRRNPYQRPARPSHRRLAGDLGIDASEIDEMRRLSGSDS